ncbi:quinone-dependent dihydroorotate dehydrogenase [Variibacter gotjawalensis]|nr:quinone-dependent dihydroorotate dehydrogenase [Variibacter gotjawalensis]
MDPEDGHRLAIKGLRFAPRPPARPDDKRLAVSAFGLAFPNPVGIAAGFDKNGEALDAALRAGCGFAEAGTVTPRPQEGNPRPRLFRLHADTAVINRMGFNNEGHDAVLARFKARAGRPGIVGINVGANKDASDRIADYVAGIRAFAPYASYFTVNVSSPNTPGLRDLQQKGVLDELLGRVLEARDAASVRRPVLLKIAPDLALGDLDDIVAVARARAIDGMIVSNTTITRPDLKSRAHVGEAGGLSGAPLFRLATKMLAETYLRVEGAFPLIGVGGISSGADAVAKVRAGATLLQVYSALVFKGLSLIGEMKSGVLAEIVREKADSVTPLIGRDAEAVSRS